MKKIDPEAELDGQIDLAKKLFRRHYNRAGGLNKTDAAFYEELRFSIAEVNVVSTNSTSARKWVSKEATSQLGTLRSALARVDQAKKRLNSTVAFIAFRDLEVSKHVATCDKLLARKAHAPAREATKKDLAAKEAAYFLSSQGLSELIVATRGNLFCKLAAIIAGTPDDNLYQQCRNAVRARKSNPGEK